MTDRYVFPSLQAARADVRQLNNATGYPRCHHPRWNDPNVVVTHGQDVHGSPRVCPCTDPSDPVDSCLSATRTVVNIYGVGNDFHVPLVAPMVTLEGSNNRRSLTAAEETADTVISWRGDVEAERGQSSNQPTLEGNDRVRTTTT